MEQRGEGGRKLSPCSAVTCVCIALGRLRSIFSAMRSQVSSQAATAEKRCAGLLHPSSVTPHSATAPTCTDFCCFALCNSLHGS
jgi:hypothetical protein